MMMGTSKAASLLSHGWKDYSSIVLLFSLFRTTHSFGVLPVALSRCWSSSSSSFVRKGREDGPVNNNKNINTSNNNIILEEIACIQRQDFCPSRDYYNNNKNNHPGKPILIRQALSASECEACCTALVAQEQLVVDLQEQVLGGHTPKEEKDVYPGVALETTIYPDCPLETAIDIIMYRSNSQTAYTAFCEGFFSSSPTTTITTTTTATTATNATRLSDNHAPHRDNEDSNNCWTLQQVQELTQRRREEIFQQQDIGSINNNNSNDNQRDHEKHSSSSSLSNDDDGDDASDWFVHFPSHLQPTDAVIFAGAGAVSTLHRDPFEWTGTSLCLEGTKLWRFLEPPFTTNTVTRKNDLENLQSQQQQRQQRDVTLVDEALASYRLKSIAWEEESINNAAQARLTKSLCLSAGWQTDEYSFFAKRQHQRIPLARDLAMAREREEQAGAAASASASDTATTTSLPCSLVDEKIKAMAMDLEILQPHLPPSPKSLPDGWVLHTVVQRPGDLLIIPAHWWHQTYGIEPSVAVASQRCGRQDVANVFRHVLSMSRAGGMSDINKHRCSSATPDAGSYSHDPDEDERHLAEIISSCGTPQEAVHKLLETVSTRSWKDV